MNPTVAPGVAPERHRQENFPVAGWLCPPALRPAVLAIYRFARRADDMADEGEVDPATRRLQLETLRGVLHAIDEGRAPEPLHADLAAAVAAHRLPLAPMHALLDAFVQDTHLDRYASREELLSYCRLSANPVGRLMLHLVGVSDERALAESDAICTALQLINHWQDVGVDRLKPRVYLPLEDLQAHGACIDDVLEGRATPALRATVCKLNAWAMDLMQQGAALPHRVPGRLGWELRLVVQGGLRVAEKIQALDGATLHQRPQLRAWDLPRLLWRALLHPRPAA
ncbi:MAG: squalene synthase HpnC [Inhella sp.]